MADIEVGPLADHLGEDEIVELTRALGKAGAPRLPAADESVAAPIVQGIDDDVLAEFLDRLDADDMACDIYLPIEFEDRLEVGDLRVGSVPTLLEVLESLKEDLGIEDDDDDDDDDDEDDDYADIDLVDNQIREVWRFFFAAATTSMEKHLPLFVTGS